MVSINSYSQNREDLKVWEYFQGKRITVLEIGANEGAFLSNSRLFIEQRSTAYLLEPGESYKALEKLYEDGIHHTHLFNFGIGEETGEFTFYESGAHVPHGTDSGLVSTTKYEETLRWRKSGVQFKETKVKLLTFDDFLEIAACNHFDFISIDCEGVEWEVLKQINLSALGCTALCIEFNGDSIKKRMFTEYCADHHLSLFHKNAENLLFFKLP